MRKLMMAAAAACTALSAPAFAGTTSTVIAVSAEVNPTCAVGTPGTASWALTDLKATIAPVSADVPITCTAGTEYTVKAHGDNDPGDGSHVLTGPNGAELTYLAYWGTNPTTPFLIPQDADPGLEAGTGTGAQETKQVTFVMLTPPATTPQGSYADNLTLTFEF